MVVKLARRGFAGSSGVATSRRAALKALAGGAAAATAFGVVGAGTAAAVADAGPIEPRAGTWTTWLLASGSQLRPPPPPSSTVTDAEVQGLRDLAARRDGAARDQVAYWDTGAPGYRWNEVVVARMLKDNFNATFASHHLALVNVAIYDATVAAWDAKYAYNRPRPADYDRTFDALLPTPRSPSYPSEHAAAAGAASTVLGYLFPDDAAALNARAEAAGLSRLIAGVHYASDVQAGLELGRAVGALVVDRAKGDGWSQPWTGTVPTGPGLWNGTNPVAPQAATWRPWVLASPDQLRPPPPFAYDSPEKAAELAELRNFPRTPKTNADAFFWEYAAGGTRSFQFWTDQIGRKLFEYGLNANPPQAARVYGTASVALYDAMVACWEGKYAYWAIRPFQLDPDFKPLFATPNHPSYPAAHGALSGAVAAALAGLFPRDAAALNGLADEAGQARIWGGIHYRSDVVAGLALGRAVARMVLDRMAV